MLNIDKVRGVLRAKLGSQVPKFEKPAGALPEIDSINKGSKIATPKLPDAAKEIPRIEDPNMKKFLDFLGKNSDKSEKWKINKAKMAALGLDYTKSRTLIGLENFANKAGETLEGLGEKLGDKLGGTLSNLVNADNLFGIASLLIDTDVDINSKGIDSAMDLVSSINPALGFGFKAINKLGAKTLDLFSTDQLLKSRMGSGYGGAYSAIDKGAEYGGKEVGMFTSSKKYRNAINRGKELLFAIGLIDSENQDRLGMIGDWNYQRLAMLNNGGFDLTLAARLGGTLDQKINLVKSRKFKLLINIDTKLIEEFKEGGSIQYNEVEWKPIIDDIADYWEPVIDDIARYEEGGKTRTLEELIEYAKKENPRFIQRLSEKPRGIKFTDDEGNEGEGSHYLEWSTDDSGNAIVYPRILEIKNDSLQFLPSNEAYKRAVNNKNILIMSPEEAEIFFAKDPEYVTAYKRGWPEFFKLFKDGGKAKEELETLEIEETTLKNLIPEGALHKNKHHMEHTEGLTLKGIPVIDNDGDQLAEIELDEIIFTLEVTKKLEELYKDGSDEAAIEAGKLLVKEILFNTDDRTGLIAKCEKGGRL